MAAAEENLKLEGEVDKLFFSGKVPAFEKNLVVNTLSDAYLLIFIVRDFLPSFFFLSST